MASNNKSIFTSLLGKSLSGNYLDFGRRMIQQTNADKMQYSKQKLNHNFKEQWVPQLPFHNSFVKTWGLTALRLTWATAHSGSELCSRNVVLKVNKRASLFLIEFFKSYWVRLWVISIIVPVIDTLIFLNHVSYSHSEMPHANLA